MRAAILVLAILIATFLHYWVVQRIHGYIVRGMVTHTLRKIGKNIPVQTTVIDIQSN